MRYIAGWFRFCVAAVFVMFIMVSVLTYNIDDPSLSSYSTLQDFADTKNVMGGLGAYLGDLLVQFLGVASVVPGIFLLLSFQKLPKTVRRWYTPCVFLVTFSFSGVASKLSLEATGRLFHGGFIGVKFAGALPLSVLIAVTVAGVFCSAGWKACMFFSRLLAKTLSGASLRVSAYRISRNRNYAVAGTGELSNYESKFSAFGRVHREPSEMNRNVFYGARGMEAAQKCYDSPQNEQKECGVARPISVLFPSKSYEYDEKLDCDVALSKGVLEEKSFDPSSCNVRDSMQHGERVVARQCNPTVLQGRSAVLESLRDRVEGSNVHNAVHIEDEEEFLNDNLECEELYDEECNEGDDDSFVDVDIDNGQCRLTVGRDSVPRKNYESSHCSIPDISNNMQSFTLPPVDLLTSQGGVSTKSVDDGGCKDESEELYSVLKDFGVYGKIIDVRYGPVVTLYEFEPSAGTKSSRIIGLADDIARSMSALSTRISVVPGRNVLGIELPNRNREMVVLRDLICSKEYVDPELKLPIILGKGIDGEPVVGDLTKMPHLLIAGTTGSGKSVGINTMILSLLYRLTPEQCRMIMIDPKVLELSVYDNIPHLLTPVVTEPKKAVAVLKWVVAEMEERYRLMSAVGVRNITGYNEKIAELTKRGRSLEIQSHFGDESTLYEQQRISSSLLPYIVVIVDEMADLMIVSGKEIESSIQRLSQMARAAGIHIIMATQRPSVDVITGVIKANFPTRISFSVTSKIDSRTILGEQGAEQLLGMGDMLYMVAGGKIRRIHGAFVSDGEVQDVVNHLRSQCRPGYVEDIAKVLDTGEDIDLDDIDDRDDALYEKAVSIVLRDRKTSVSYVQRQLRIGYNRAANLVERMEREGIITAGSFGKREIVGS